MYCRCYKYWNASNTICGSAICEQQTKLIWFRVSQVADIKRILWPPSYEWWMTPVQIMKSPMTSRQWAEKVIWCILHTKNALRPIAPWMELLSEQIQSIFLCPPFFVRYLSRKWISNERKIRDPLGQRFIIWQVFTPSTHWI